MKYKKQIIIGVMILCTFLFFSPILFKSLVPPGISKLESASYLSQIITNLFVICGVIIALWQYIIYSRREIEQKDRELYDIDKARIQKAIDLSEYFKDNVLGNFGPLSHVFKKTKVLEIMNKIPKDKMCQFDLQELKLFLNKDDLQAIINISDTKEFMNALYQICMTDEKWSVCLKELEVVEEGKIMKTVQLNKSTVLSKFNDLLESTLNNLEFFSMHFTHGTADESVVYQSLHNSFIRIVELVYCQMCLNNDGNSEVKYYTNTIELFSMWKGMSIVQRDNEYAITREQIRKGNKLPIK